jgi:DNA-directed RNA polymerase beta' subunit
MFVDIHDIACIEFGVYSPEEIRQMSVCKIDSSKLSGQGTVYDERMGCITDTNEPCVTCGLKKECWGHFGYIDLGEPVLHPMYYKMIAIFLKCFCKHCHRLLLIDDQIELAGIAKMKNERKFNKILEKVKKIDICSHCSSPQPKIIYKAKDMTISMEYKQKKNENKISIIMEVDDIKKIFDNILEKDLILLGFDPQRIQPKNLIITVLPVIPPCSRPYVVAEGNICDDDLTYQLVEIVKINNQLVDPAVQGQKRQKLINTLRFRITTMFNNSNGKAKHPTDSRPLKGLKERLTGKGGRIRSNTMGKRVDFSARTVIGAEPTLRLNQVGIPFEVAQIHTKPEVVTPFNIQWLTEIVNSGKANFLTTVRNKKDSQGNDTAVEVKTRINLQYALFRKGTELIYGDVIVRGETEVKKDKRGNLVIPHDDKNFVYVKTGKEVLQTGDRLIRDGKFIDAKCPTKKNIKLNIGDIVERQLQKGDIVLFNRQPTLHKGSMLAMEVVPMPHKSFRFNLAATKSFNADFDGDEMNVHAPQSYEAEAELRMISSTSLNIITPQESKPIITITQDSLIAAFLMTKIDFKLTQNQFSNICMKGEKYDGNMLYDPERLKTIQKVLKQHGKKEVFNGRGLLSMILPVNFNYEKKNSAHPEEPVVKIKQGVFLEGALDKSTLGSAHGSIIQILNKEYGHVITANFIDNMQFIGNAWLMVHGFSVGLEDCMITSEESVMAIKNKLTECYTKAEGIEETTQNPGIREVRITAALSQAKDIGMKIAKDAMRTDNNFLVTVTSGAKGDYFNIAQITGLLGQQNLEGKRVAPTLSHGKRTLPHYPFEKLSKEREYESRGFIRHSFIRGLTPQEFFFHAMSGREGVADTAMGTATSGYIQRKIVKVCEDIKIQYDQTVRDATGKIYQFYYGENGYDSTKTIRVNNQVNACDVKRLIERLNTSYEIGIDNNDIIPQTEEPEIKCRTMEHMERKISHEEKPKIIRETKKMTSQDNDDDDNEIDELEEDEEDEEDEDELEEDEEDEEIDLEEEIENELENEEDEEDEKKKEEEELEDVDDDIDDYECEDYGVEEADDYDEK